MKKGFILLISVGLIYMLFWFACNPFQDSKSSSSSEVMNTLDGSEIIKATGAAEIYAAPNGVAGAAGTISAPTTFTDAIAQIAEGGTIWMRGGTYSCSSMIVIAEGNNGASGSLKKVFAYGSEVPVLNFSAQSFNSANRGVVLAGNYWHFKSITIQGAGDNGMLLAGHYNTIESCTFLKNRDSGLQLSRYNTSYSSISQWPHDNTIVSCYSHDNYDTDNGEDADGFAAKLTSGVNNVFRNCISKNNSDDGWDLYTKEDTGAIGAVKFYSCEASNNGVLSDGSGTAAGDGNGFKLGDDTAAVSHYLQDCVANNNKKYGYTGNGNPGPITLVNCTGSGNGEGLFDRL